MTDPRITIVIPSFNHAAFLEDAIRSVVEQRYDNIELIVIDGGSTDGSVAVLERHASVLAYWISEADEGPADALRKGLARASGDIYGVLNADDFLLPGALATVARVFTAQPDVDVVSGHGYFARRDGTLGVALYSDRLSLDALRWGACVLVQPATFFRRSAFERVGGFRREKSLCWDMELWADMAEARARFVLVDGFLAAFRLHERSITGRPDLQRSRRLQAREVMARLRGRPETTVDRIRHAATRLRKFLAHPDRVIRQRWYFRKVLGRWSL